MENLIKLLQDEKKLKEKIAQTRIYGYMGEGNHLKEILELNKQYRKDNPSKYGYNADIVNYIMEKENIPKNLKDMVDTQVYFSQKDLEKEKQKEYENKMLADGWIKLTIEIVKEALNNNKKIILSATHTNDWATLKVEKVLKPHLFGDKYGLMEPRGKTRGYSLSQFDNAFCKLV